MPTPAALSLSSRVAWLGTEAGAVSRPVMGWPLQGRWALEDGLTQAQVSFPRVFITVTLNCNTVNDLSNTVNCNTVNDLSNTANNLLETEFPGKKSVCKPVPCLSVSLAKAPLCFPFLNESCTQWQVLPNFHKIWFFIFFYSFSSCLINSPNL